MSKQSSETDAAFITRAMGRTLRSLLKQFPLPGLAVGVVKGGNVLYLRGFGQGNVGRGLEVTPETRFAVASTTKAITGTAACILVDDGRLDLDMPVSQYVPDFKLKDPVATQLTTMRDLLSHRTGLPSHDFMWYNTDLCREDIFHRLRYLEPTKDFRQAFQYNNLGYMAAGVIIERLSGLTWEEFVRIRIFDPLDMKQADFGPPPRRRNANDAAGHRLINGGFKVIPYMDVSPVGPAGSVFASAADMCKWLTMNLNGGRYKGKPVVSKRALAEARSPVVALPHIPTEDEFLPSTYALGWRVSAYRGRLRLSHNGGLNGFRSHVSLLPRQRLGMVLLCNLDPEAPSTNCLPDVISHCLLDKLLGLGRVPWVRRYRQGVKAQRPEKKAAGRRTGVGRRPARPVEDYVGEYRHPAYGLLKVTTTGDRLKTEIHRVELRMRHVDGDDFIGNSATMKSVRMTFRADKSDRVRAVAAALVSSNPDLDIVFKRTVKSKS